MRNINRYIIKSNRYNGSSYECNSQYNSIHTITISITFIDYYVDYCGCNYSLCFTNNSYNYREHKVLYFRKDQRPDDIKSQFYPDSIFRLIVNENKYSYILYISSNLLKKYLLLYIDKYSLYKEYFKLLKIDFYL
jgi:hypothetical protein